MFKRYIDQERDRRSTGIEELDVLLGGGIRNGEILLLVQQESVRYHIGLHRVFLAQGLEENERVVHSSLDNPVVSVPGLQQAQETGPATSQEKIAWRYTAMSRTANTARIQGSAANTARRFNLRAQHPKQESVAYVKEASLSAMLAGIKAALGKNTRVSLSSLFSPIWGASSQEANDFLFGLRAAIRQSGAVCMVSVPVYLLDSFNYGYFDSVVRLEANTVKELKYDGFIQCVKTEVNDVHKYAVLCQSTGIRVEKIVLPPE
ncbi:elongator complex protein 4 [Nematocida major]|uniref:elongator complex protein 4 n=1 Tax=Nematocida major TaxID=1912982 RepID=UPI0020088B6C|nr:elongator complex protein 4 [Nematocida major]KAH9386474.1 elongator complex protein 4 [Nematocida major]